MRKIYFLLLLMLTKCLIIDAQPKYFHTGVECSGSTTCIYPFCFLSRQQNEVFVISKINTGCTLLRPLLKINVSDIDFLKYLSVHTNLHLSKVQQVTKQKYGLYNNYKPIISYPPFEWCKVMLDSAINPLYKFMVQAVSNSVPELFHICPYWGPVNAYNMTLNMDKIFALFAPGEYSNTLTIFDDVEKQIFKIKIFTTVV